MDNNSLWQQQSYGRAVPVSSRAIGWPIVLLSGALKHSHRGGRDNRVYCRKQFLITAMREKVYYAFFISE
jgi:hypothetical protein